MLFSQWIKKYKYPKKDKNKISVKIKIQNLLFYEIMYRLFSKNEAKRNIL